MSAELRNVSFVVKGKIILDDVSFKIENGEFVSLLGASGAGKSTAVKIMAGILEQTDGHVFIDGDQVDAVPAHKRKVSIAFQDMRLFPHMSVGENVGFAMRMQGVKKKKRIERAEHYLELVHLKDFVSRRVDEISGGQQQRVALARAIAANPRIMLLDEPFSGLDEDLRDDMRLLVLEIHRSLGISTMMVTHDAYEALMMSDRIVYMTDGRVVQDGTPDELYSRPQTLAAASCFGRCTTLPGRVEQGIFDAWGLHFATTCPDGPAQAVIRHDAISETDRDAAGARVAGARADSSTAVEAVSTATENRSIESLVAGDGLGDQCFTVKQCIYHGDAYLVTIALETEDVVFSSKHPLEKGKQIALSINTAQAFVFPDV
jgi:putative spermidine/putrescine transport system ATP-binding protein